MATDETEIGRLDALFERATQNGVPDIELVDSDGIRQREPICQGLKALWEVALRIGSKTIFAIYGFRCNK